ncbi:MAG: DUF3307 domain-containing protein [Syntrophomonadaceae bacterium]
MTLFEALLVGHLVGDFLFQNRWMADNKSKKVIPLVVHSLVYSLSIFALAWLAGGISLMATGIIFISHVLLDERRFTRWWITNISRSPDIGWVQFAVDQVFHILLLSIVAYFFTRGFL